MILKGDASDEEWELVRRGNYVITDGKRIPVNNSRQNKWWIKSLNSGEESLACFDDQALQRLSIRKANHE